MGTGKSTLAAELSRTLAIDLLRTDVVRQELQGPSKHPANYAEGLYSTAGRTAVYNELFERAAILLRDGLSVILDGTFLAASLIERSAELAQNYGATFLYVRCTCTREVSLQRISDRDQKGLDPSEARTELYDLQKEEQEAPPASISVREVDTQQPLPHQAAMVQSTLAELLRRVS